MTGQTLPERFARWTYGLEYAAIPEPARHAARRILLDTLGVMCAGQNHDATRKVRDGLLDGGVGAASLAGGGTSSPAIAALVNGTATHALDYDDVSYPAIIHGSTIIAPAVLAVAETTGASDEAILTAFVAASEIAYVLGDVVTLEHFYRGWWATASLSIIGATAAVAKLHGQSREQIQSAIALAACASAITRAALGTTGKPFLAGFAAKTAVELALATGAGITAPDDALEGKQGFIQVLNGGHADLPAAASLGERWRIVDPGVLVKRYPMCSSALAGVEQMIKLRDAHGITPDDVATIRCEVTGFVALSLKHDEPATPHEAMFSTPFTVACALHHGNVKVEHLTPAIVSDPAIRATMNKVSWTVDPSLATGDAGESTPEAQRTTITTTDGREFSGVTDIPSGMPERPLSDGQLIEKFIDCARSGGIGDARAGETARALMACGTDARRGVILDAVRALLAG